MAEKIKILPDGRMAFVNDDGEIISVQKVAGGREGLMLRQGRSAFAIQKQSQVRCALRVNKRGQQHMVPITMREEDLDNLPDDLSYFDAFRKTCMDVAAKISDGYTLMQIGKMQEMPSRRTILYWSSKDPAFAAVLEEARKWRAETFHDKVLEIADAAEESNAKSSKVKIDAYRWGAEVGDREKFGSQTKHIGDANKPIAFIIDTGIHEEIKPIPAKGNVVEQEKDSDGLLPETTPDGDPQGT